MEGSSPTLSWNGTMIAIHTSDVFPRNQGNISSSTKGPNSYGTPFTN